MIEHCSDFLLITDLWGKKLGFFFPLLLPRSFTLAAVHIFFISFTNRCHVHLVVFLAAGCNNDKNVFCPRDGPMGCFKYLQWPLVIFLCSFFCLFGRNSCINLHLGVTCNMLLYFWSILLF